MRDPKKCLVKTAAQWQKELDDADKRLKDRIAREGKLHCITPKFRNRRLKMPATHKTDTTQMYRDLVHALAGEKH